MSVVSIGWTGPPPAWGMNLSEEMINTTQVRATLRPPSGLPVAALMVALGVITVSASYARNRAGESWAGPLYWTGEILVLLAPAIFVWTKRAVSAADGVGLAIILGVASYAIRQCYRPVQFTFSDEFQHLTAVQNILNTSHLFHANPTLPISADYPGLEVITSAIVRLSHLSIYSSAAVTVGIAHVVMTVGVFLFALEVLQTPRQAVIATLIYATGPQYQFFTSYFAYESLSLPLMIMSLVAFMRAMKTSSRGESSAWTVASLTLALGTIVTHHASSYALFGLEVILVITWHFTRAAIAARWYVLSVPL